MLTFLFLLSPTAQGQDSVPAPESGEEPASETPVAPPAPDPATTVQPQLAPVAAPIPHPEPVPAPQPAPTPVLEPEPVPAPQPEPVPAPESAELPRGTFQSGGFQFRPLIEVRERLEARSGRWAGGATTPNQLFIGSRARLGLDARYEGIRVLVQMADARSFGQYSVGTDNGATTGLHQGFFELSFDGGWLRVGRQDINYGHQRMLGSLNWTTSGRAFDALRLHASFGDSQLDILGAVTRWVATVTQEDPDDPTDSLSDRSEGGYLAALYYTWAAIEAFRLEAYVLFRHDGGVDGNIDRQRNIASPGVRLHGQPVAGMSYELEFVFQAGNVSDDAFTSGDDRHLALALAAELAYVVQVPFRPGFALGFSYASGGSGDDSLREFDNFFPTNHLFYGSNDLFSWRNLIHGYFRLSAAPQGAPVRVSLNNHVFFLADPDERWAHAGGGTIGVNATNDERFLGYELDLNVAIPIRSWLKIAFGYSVFFPLGAGSDALLPGPDPTNPVDPEPTHWGYLMIGSTLP